MRIQCVPDPFRPPPQKEPGDEATLEFPTQLRSINMYVGVQNKSFRNEVI